MITVSANYLNSLHFLPEGPFWCFGGAIKEMRLVVLVTAENAPARASVFSSLSHLPSSHP